jgi:hypothetical protein
VLLTGEAAAATFGLVGAIGKAATPPSLAPPAWQHVGLALHYDGPALLAFLLPLALLAAALLVSAFRLSLLPERAGPLVRACVVAQPALLFIAGG